MQKKANFFFLISFLSFLTLSALPHSHELGADRHTHQELSVEHEDCLLCNLHFTTEILPSANSTLVFSSEASLLVLNEQSCPLVGRTSNLKDRAPPVLG